LAFLVGPGPDVGIMAATDLSDQMPAMAVIHVWHAAPGLAASPGSRHACLDLLDPGERERLERYRFEADAEAYLAAHALLRSALSPSDPRTWRFRKGRHGKPFVEEPAIHRCLAFSLSHTSGRVAVAIGRQCELGIDVEHAEVGASILENLGRFLSPMEVRSLGAMPSEHRAARFLVLWTLREAALKACGTGLSGHAGGLSFDLDSGSAPSASFPPEMREDPANWHFRCFDATGRHPVAVAIRCPSGGNVTVKVNEARELPLPFATQVAPTPPSVGLELPHG
jgi:4'-phosphopantetheinyl transferase